MRTVCQPVAGIGHLPIRQIPLLMKMMVMMMRMMLVDVMVVAVMGHLTFLLPTMAGQL